MLGKEGPNQVNGGSDRATEAQNEKLASGKAKVPTCESDSGRSSGNLDSSLASSLQMESLFSGQKLSNSADAHDKLPTPSLAERDRIHLGRIFPEEVWHLIFDQLDNSADLENVSNSSLYFRDLLSPRRVNFLFHNVWNYFGELFYFNYSCRGNIYDIVIPPNHHVPSGNHDNNEHTVGGKADWYKEIVKLRLVSRTWNTVIDNFYQNHPIHFRLQNHVDPNEDTVRNFLHTNLRLSNLVQGRRENELLRHFAPTHTNANRNPFLGRCVSINFHSGREYNFIEGILFVLLEYGHLIWYCTIVINDFASGVECYSRIWGVLRLMPNLKVIRVEANCIKRLSKRKSDELQADINLKPLPTLKKLQMVRISDLLPSIFLEIIRRNEHVSTLDIDRQFSRYRYGIFRVPLQNLNKLVISFYSEIAFLKMGRDTVNWPLTELNLDLKSSSTFIDWQKIFSVLEKFKNTLTQLDLKLPVAEDEEDREQIDCESYTFRLHLPFLTKFSVEMRNVSCLDFMLPMKDSLSELVVRIGVTNYKKIKSPFRKVEAGKGRIVKFLSCAKRLLDSNVWTLFPKVNNVRLNVYSINCPERDETFCEDREKWQWQKMMKMLTNSDSSE